MSDVSQPSEKEIFNELAFWIFTHSDPQNQEQLVVSTMQSNQFHPHLNVILNTVTLVD